MIGSSDQKFDVILLKGCTSHTLNESEIFRVTAKLFLKSTCKLVNHAAFVDFWKFGEQDLKWPC
jgi:hypothetical protein